METPALPSRIFADGEEPVGERANSYFKLNTIRVVLKALQPDELEVIRPAFGKLLDVYSKPAFSGKLAHFLLTRQLDIGKLHEIWVILCGSPIKFSLREFGIVTGLNCNPLPVTDDSTVKAKPGVTPYWFTLFGGEENVTGEILTLMLRKSKNLSSETRVKYACLLLVDGLLCRRSFHMKIPKEHVEMIRNLDYFLSYPWGRHTFNVTMDNIKKKEVSQLAQVTVAVQGFIHALQLVVLEAVPAVMCAISDGTDPESGDEDNSSVSTLKLDKLWDLDKEGEVAVTSIINDPLGVSVTMDFSWTDEKEDEAVDIMEKHIAEGVLFNREMFTGGRRGFAPPSKAVNNKAGKGKRKGSEKGGGRSVVSPSRPKQSRSTRRKVQYDGGECNPNFMEAVAVQIRSAMAEAQSAISEKLVADMQELEASLVVKITANVEKFVEDRLKGKAADDTIATIVNDITSTTGLNGNAVKAGNSSQSGNTVVVAKKNSTPKKAKKKAVTAVAREGEKAKKNSCPRVEENEDQVKFSYLEKNILITRELCFGPQLVLKVQDLVNIPSSIPTDRPEIMDACIMMFRESLLDSIDPSREPRADMLTCSFIADLGKQFPKFRKITRPENFEFDPKLISFVRARAKEAEKEWLADIDVIYFPFNVDKNRWIAVMVDLHASSLIIFDPSKEERRCSRMKPELNFVCEMLPYLVRKASVNEDMKNFSLSPLSFSRDTSVPQASAHCNTGLLSLLFIEAHATGGYAGLRSVHEGMLLDRGQKLVVDMYEHCCGENYP